MSKKIGVLGKIYQHLRNSLGAPKQIVVLAGEDHHGNRYFEKESDPARNRRGSRWVETQDSDEFTVPEVPPEWDAWLRGRRKMAPSPEEIQRNYAMMMRTIQRAKDLEAKDRIESGSFSESKKSESYTSTVDSHTYENKFPTYEEYEINPGDIDKQKQEPQK